MAKRKRLVVPDAMQTAESDSKTTELETKSMPRYPLGVHPPVSSRPPIAQVAAEASAQAALEEVSNELDAARSEGRMVLSLPLEKIKEDHLVRDRMVIDAEDMDALMGSLRSRGQQTPIEVVQLEAGQYGLISGWRRVSALKALLSETGEGRFATVQALVRPLNAASDSYVAMVEENEVRANLSFYERARLAAEAAKLGIYPTPERAVQKLFAAASASKRSKITAFLKVHATFAAALSFPAAIPEKLGLALSSALDADPQFAKRLKDILRQLTPATAAEERAVLERALKRVNAQGQVMGKAKALTEKITPDIALDHRKGRVVLSGKGVNDDLLTDLRAWLATR